MGSGRRAGQRFDAQHGVATESLIFLGDLDPEAVGPAIEFATHYEATPIADFERLIATSPIASESATFIDIGSGMGRAVLLAARLPFRRIVGIEISPALHEVACQNLARFRDPRQRCRDIRLVRGDASRFRFPRGNTVLYLYNPFRAPILRSVLTRALQTAGSDRDVVLLYHTPLERAVIEEIGALELIADLGFGLAYRSARRAP